MMPIIESQAQRDALIERAKKWEAICNVGYVTDTDKLDMLISRIALAALEAVPKGVVIHGGAFAQTGKMQAGDSVYTAPPVPVLKPVVLPTTRLWAGKIDCFSKEDVLSMLREAGYPIAGEDNATTD